MDDHNQHAHVIVKADQSDTFVAHERSLRIGPIPSPDEFAAYKQVMPDLPERIVSQFEADSAHIRALQVKEQDGNISFDRRSQWMAVTLILAGLAGTVFLSYTDKDVAAFLTGAGTVALILNGTFSRKE